MHCPVQICQRTASSSSYSYSLGDSDTLLEGSHPILAESRVLQVRLQNDPPDRAVVREGLRQRRQVRGEDAARRLYQGVGRRRNPGRRRGQPSATEPLVFENVVAVVGSLPPTPRRGTNLTFHVTTNEPHVIMPSKVNRLNRSLSKYCLRRSSARLTCSGVSLGFPPLRERISRPRLALDSQIQAGAIGHLMSGLRELSHPFVSR
ncbi:hypothetical protein DL771_005191 [Monosporascus sp. 5C6A]|nr:hypothetical protein DL771_005191 [Monosporascus sp. 5C6A]